MLYVIVYVDDLIVTGDQPYKIDEFVSFLAKKFALKDLRSLSYFLGIEVIPNSTGLVLSQRLYILELLARTNMQDAKSILTPLPTNAQLTLNSGTHLQNASEYRTIVGSDNSRK